MLMIFYMLVPVFNCYGSDLVKVCISEEKCLLALKHYVKTATAGIDEKH